MAASPWTVFDYAKRAIGNGVFTLSGATGLRMSLHRTSASANLIGAITTWASIGDECSGGGYSRVTLGAVTWLSGTSTGVRVFDFSDPVFTASLSTLSAVRYAVVCLSAGAVTSGIPLIYAALSTAEFDVTTSNTLTIQLATTGAFTLA
jgi:hypothetical protein